MRTAIFAVSTSNQAATFVPVASALAGRGWHCIGLSLEEYFGLPIRWPPTHCLNVTYVPNTSSARKQLWQCEPEEWVFLGRKFWSTLKEVFEELRPSVVVQGNDRGFLERMVTKRARLVGAKTVLVQDGALTGKSLEATNQSIPSRAGRMFWEFLASLAPERWGAEPFLRSPTPPYGSGELDAVAVSDVHSAHLLRARGVDERRICLTGQPRFDRLWHLRAEAVPLGRALAEKYGERVPLVLATQPMVDWGEVQREDYERYLSSILEASRLYHDRIILLIRPHPSEQPAFYVDIASSLAPDSAVVVTDWDTQTLTAASGGLITAYSTCALEAIILDKPLLLVNPFPVEQGLPYHAEGAALEIKDLSLVPEAIRTVFLERSGWDQVQSRRLAFLERYVGPIDGQAAQRVASLIERVASA